MKKLILGLHPFTDEDAVRVADDIRLAGEISYTDPSGAVVVLFLDEVTVENA